MSFMTCLLQAPNLSVEALKTEDNPLGFSSKDNPLGFSSKDNPLGFSSKDHCFLAGLRSARIR